MNSFRRQFRTLVVVLPLFLLPALAAAQDQPPQAEAANAPEDGATSSPAEAFQKLNRQWKALDERLNELQQAYVASPSAAARAEVRKQYEELVARSQELLPELQAAAKAAYDAAPNKDPDVLRTMIGLVAYEYRRDDYEAALKLAKSLEDEGCDEGVLYAVAGAAAYNADRYDLAEQYLKRAEKAGKLDADGTKLLAELPEQKAAWDVESAIRAREAELDDLPRVKLETNKGTIVIELFENEAPQAVGNFVSLVEKKFYDGLTFHRVLPGFMAQGGDPEGTGGGGPGYEIYCECDKPEARKHFRGTLSMAHAGKNTGGSQFFLTFRPTTHLNGRHTAFGRVVEGMDVLAKLQRRDPQSANPPAPDKIVKAEVLRKRDHVYQPTKVQ
jgi:cyclophilin family peptidyl-prolyl cis-trans isomerase